MLAKYGPNKLFGDDTDERKKLDDGPAIRLFDSVWQNKLDRAVKMADPCDSDYAYERLTNRQQNSFDHSQEHRSFRLQELNAEFLVQLDSQEDGAYILTQLWRISSSDTHPKTLFVTFKTVEEREQFRQLAQNLGIHDEELGGQLLRDFMEKHPRRFLTGRT